MEVKFTWTEYIFKEDSINIITDEIKKEFKEYLEYHYDYYDLIELQDIFYEFLENKIILKLKNSEDLVLDYNKKELEEFLTPLVKQILSKYILIKYKNSFWVTFYSEYLKLKEQEKRDFEIVSLSRSEYDTFIRLLGEFNGEDFKEFKL
jgi:hypothetical protein